ncbi:MAG: SBBP repeat-containing protein [Chloroflexota bacterium]
MHPIRAVRSCILLMCLLAANAVPAGVASASVPRSPGAARHQQFGQRAPGFEVNQGQVSSQVRFLARGQGYTLFLTTREAVIRLPHGKDVRLRYEGAAPSRPSGQQKLPGRVNYLLGNDPRGWHTDIPTYARVEYQAVYPGVNLAYFGRHGHVEYDWIVTPGARVSTIRMGIDGGNNPRIDAQGNLLLAAQQGILLQRAPVVYQQIRGKRLLVRARYRLVGRHQVGFTIGTYDPMRTLIIDPTLIYATYLGGSNTDGGAGIAVDRKGSAYITGDTLSLDFPTAHPVQGALRSDASCRGLFQQSHGTCVDAFVTKLSPDGSTLLYSTFLGGMLNDYGYALAVDAAGNVYVTGGTSSTDFPVVHALQSHFGGGGDLGDAFVTKLSPAGDRILFSTYLGGGGDEDGQGIAIAGGSVYITGRTNSSNFPVRYALQPRLGGGACSYPFHAVGKVPCYDAFVSKMSADGKALEYSTYLGGSRTDFGWAIAVYRGRAIIVGQTTSVNIPMVHAVQRSYAAGMCGVPGQEEPCNDAYVAELSVSGQSLLVSTYLGGKKDDIAHGVAVDHMGNIVVVGETQSRRFPTLSALEPRFRGDATMGFVTKFAAAGNRLVYSTFLGGSGIGGDVAYDVALDTAGDAYVVGSTTSSDFPITRAIDGHLSSGGNVQNGFITKITASGSALVYSTYLGGSDHDLAGSVAVDAAGNAYVTGFATSTNFPTAHPFQRRLTGGTFDVILAKIGNPHAALPVRSSANHHARKTVAAMPQKTRVCGTKYQRCPGR